MYCCIVLLLVNDGVSVNGHFNEHALHYELFHFYISRFIRPEEMDDEVTQIFKKWKLNNPTLPKKDEDLITTAAPNVTTRNNETFDSRTFTRPPKRRTFVTEQTGNNYAGTQPKTSMTENEMQSIESGVCSRSRRKKINEFLFNFTFNFLDCLNKSSSWWRYDTTINAKELAARCFST